MDGSVPGEGGAVMAGGVHGEGGSIVRNGSGYGEGGHAAADGCSAANGCMKCGKALTYNEVGAYKKFINRGSTRFLCKECLAAKLDVTVEDIERKIEQFRQQGCTLFI